MLGHLFCFRLISCRQQYVVRRNKPWSEEGDPVDPCTSQRGGPGADISTIWLERNLGK